MESFYVGSTLNDLEKEFGKNRVVDTPVSENAVTASAFGYCLQGGPACVVHPRVDFGILATDSIFNTISKCVMYLEVKKNQSSHKKIINAVENKERSMLVFAIYVLTLSWAKCGISFFTKINIF